MKTVPIWPKLLPLGLAIALLAPAARADVKLPALFTPHMVLQRDQADRVWGWADPGEEIAVSIAGQTKSTKAGDDGKWMVSLDPMPAGGPHKLTVKGKNEITLDDVLVGEVWVCSGQSNMQWAVGQSNDADLERLTANYPRLRFISVPQVGTQEMKDDFDGKWEVCTPETVGQFSAVGYFFGRQLHQTLGIPIGLIDDAWGGSACEAWIRRDILEADAKYAPLIERWKKMEAEFASADTPAERKKQLEGQMRGNARPGNIYNGVLKPTIGYGIKGAIWYQGESNAGRAYQYRDLFPLMIQSWRDEWGQGDFSFYWVQLADFMKETTEPVDSAWAELREAQTMTAERLPNTGQAVIIDIGEGQDIHPRNKQDVANRLARHALKHDYGIDIACDSPTYAGMQVKDGKIHVDFKNVGSGLKAFDFPDVLAFTVAGEDRKFYNASAKVLDTDTVEITCEAVAKPVAVRYAWADNPDVNLYTREGLPVTPFRTDDWPGVTAEAK